MSECVHGCVYMRVRSCPGMGAGRLGSSWPQPLPGVAAALQGSPQWTLWVYTGEARSQQGFSLKKATVTFFPPCFSLQGLQPGGKDMDKSFITIIRTKYWGQTGGNTLVLELRGH